MKTNSLILLLTLPMIACTAQQESEPTNLTESNEIVLSGIPEGSREDPFLGEGFVRAINDDGSVTIEHETILGFMDGMTMSFPVSNEALLESLQVNEKIEFSIEILEDGYHIFRIEKTEHAGEENGDIDTEMNSTSAH